MKIRLLSVALLVLLCTKVLFAQETAHYDEKIRKVTALLNLTPEQQAKYKTLLINTDKEKESLMAKAKTVSPEEKKRMQDEFKINYEKQLKKILTPEQFKKLVEGAKGKK